MSFLVARAGRTERLSAYVALGLFALLLFLTAWVGDDCFFTLRTVENLLHGHGPVWNPLERVQAYTHPLWMLFLTAAVGITGEGYFTTLLCSIALSLTACVLLVQRSATPAAGLLVLTLAVLSRAFVDFSTSGLENALSFAIFALFFRVHSESARGTPAPCRLALVVALAALTRLDTTLIYLPALAVHAWRASGLPELRPRAIARTLAELLLGLSPLLLWELFSLFYYGFPFPNTAYAKLGTGIPRGELWSQGLWYLRASLWTDPVTPLTIVGASLLAAWRPRRELAPLCLGTLLYCAYVAHIGGDFMGGRFLALPFFVSLAVVGQYPLRWRKPMPALAALAGVAALALHRVDLVLRDGAIAESDRRGVIDGRMFCYPMSGLLRSSGRFRTPLYRETKPLGADLGFTFAGSTAYAAGPDEHVIEPYGLADALLARLPARFRLDWRIGHFTRILPPGYTATLASGTNRIEDPGLARYYAYLCEVIRGPLLSRSRLRRILDFNLGRYDDLIDETRYRYPLLGRFPLLAGESGSWSFAGELERLPLEGIRLEASGCFRASEIELDARGPIGRIELLCRETVVWSRDLAKVDGRPAARRATPPSEPLRVAVGDVTADALWIVPIASWTSLSGVTVRPPPYCALVNARLR